MGRMSFDPDMEEGNELQDLCIDMQVKTNLDDMTWEEQFGNKNGLYGFVQQEKLKAQLHILKSLTIHEERYVNASQVHGLIADLTKQLKDLDNSNNPN